MKKIKYSIVAIATIVSQSVIAQQPTTTTAVPVVAQPTPATNTSTTSEATTVAPSKWAASYFNYMNGPALAESPNGMSINHYLGLKYKFESKWATSFTLRPDTNHENGEEKNLILADPYVRVEYPTIYENQNGLKLVGNVNYFIPTSDASKNANSNGSITTRFILTKDIAKISLTYLLIPRWYSWSQPKDGQSLFSQTHYMAASYNASDFWSLDFSIAPAWTQKRNARTAFNDLPAYPGATINFTKKFSFSPYVEVPLLKAEQKNSSVGASVSYKLL